MKRCTQAFSGVSPMLFVSVIKVGTEDWFKGIENHMVDDQTSVENVHLFSLSSGEAYG